MTYIRKCWENPPETELESLDAYTVLIYNIKALILFLGRKSDIPDVLKRHFGKKLEYDVIVGFAKRTPDSEDDYMSYKLDIDNNYKLEMLK